MVIVPVVMLRVSACCTVGLAKLRSNAPKSTRTISARIGSASKVSAVATISHSGAPLPISGRVPSWAVPA